MSNKARLYLATDKSTGNNNPSVINGNFDGNANGWTVAPGWNYNSGSMQGELGSTATLSQSISNIQLFKIYKLSFFLTFEGGGDEGQLSLTIGGNSRIYTTPGFKTETIFVVNTNPLVFTQSYYWRGRLDNVSISSFDNEYTWEEVHLADDESINLNFAIADIEDITKRGTIESQL